MAFRTQLCIFLVAVVCTTSTSAYFFSWGSPQPVKTLPPQNQQQLPQYPTLAYYQRVMQTQQPQYVDSNGVQMQPLQPIPAIPIQVPLQAQFAPAPAVQNVQLVPCLCPVSQDMEYVDQTAGQAKPTPATMYQQQPQPAQQPPSQN